MWQVGAGLVLRRKCWGVEELHEPKVCHSRYDKVGVSLVRLVCQSGYLSLKKVMLEYTCNQMMTGNKV